MRREGLRREGYSNLLVTGRWIRHSLLSLGSNHVVVIGGAVG